MACVQAFEKILKYPIIKQFRSILIISDSRYVIDNQNNAVYNWPRNKYRKAGGGLVENADIWKKWLKGRMKLSKLLKGVRVELVWKERRSNEHMKMVDRLAKAASSICDGAPFRPVGVRRHIMPVKPGEVNFFGQRMTIYVVTAEKMKVQKMNKYSCQVITKGNTYYKRKGIIYSPDQLREGRRYTVTCTECRDDIGICNIQIHRRYRTKKEAAHGASQNELL